MSNKIALATIQFKADAKGANAALESMRQSAKETEQKVADLQRAFDNGVKTMKDANGVEFNVAEELKRAKAEAKSFNDGIAQLIKGATALESVVKNIRLGEIEKNTRGELKGALNALDMRRRNLKEESPDYAERKKDFDDAEAEIKKQINRIDHDTDRLLKTLSEGGSVAKEVIDKEMKGLEDILKLIPETTEEWKKYAAQLKEIRGYVDEMNKQELKQTASILGDQNLGQYNETQIREAIKAGEQLIKTYETASPEAKRLAEEIVRAEEHLEQYGTKAERAARREAKAIEDAAERRRKSDEMMQQQLQKGTNLTESALKQQEQYWRKLIDDPKTAAESLQQYGANLAHVKSLQEQMASDAIRTKGEEALSFFRGNTSDASADTIQTQAKALKAYRDSLPRKTEANTIAEINTYLEQAGAVAGKAAAQTMSFKQAMQVGMAAGKGNFTGTTEQLTLAKKTLEEMSKGAVKGGLAWRRMQEQIRNVDLELQKTEKLSQEVEKVLNQPKGKSMNELADAIKRAEARMRGLASTDTEYKKLASQIKVCKEELRNLEGQSQVTSSAFEKAWSRLKTYVGVYVSAAVAMQKIMATFSNANELSDKMGEVGKTTNMTSEQLAHLQESLGRISTRQTMNELMSLSAAAGQLGLKAEQDVLAFTRAANKITVALPEMGREGVTELMKIAKATGTVDELQKQINHGLIEDSNAVEAALTRVGSTIDALRANSASTAPRITDFVKRVGAVGAQSGLTIDKVAALGSTVDALGLRVEMSATALSRMIPAIKNNAFAISKVIGIAPEEINRMYEAGDAMQVIIKLLKTMSGKGEDEIEGMLNQSGFGDILAELNQQGARAGMVFAGLSQNVAELERQLDIAHDAFEENIAIEQEYLRMNETSAGKLAQLGNTLTNFFVRASTSNFLGKVYDFLNWFFKNWIENPRLQLFFNTLIGYLVVMKTNLVAIIAQGTIAGIKAIGDAFVQIGRSITNMFGGLKNVKKGIEEVDKSTRAMNMANAWLALATAIWMAYNAIKAWYEEAHKVQKIASEAMSRVASETDAATRKVDKFFDSIGNARVAIEDAKKEVESAKKAVDEAKKSLDGSRESVEKLEKAESDLKIAEEKSTKANDDHAASIRKLNQEYEPYLGYMLSEISTAQEVANARELINAKLEETIRLKQKEAGYGRIEEEFGGKRDEKRQDLYSEIGGIISDPTSAAQLRKDINNIIKKNLDQEVSDPDAYWKVMGELDKLKEQYNITDITERNKLRIAVDKLLRVERKIAAAKKVIDDNFNADIKAARVGSEYTKGTQQELKEQFKAIDEGEKTGLKHLEQLYKEADDKTRKERAAALLKQMDAYEKLLANSENFFDRTEKDEEASYRVLRENGDKRMKELREQREKLIEEAGDAYQSSNNPGNSYKPKNPWGDKATAETPYEQWDADALVARRKSMNTFVRALSEGTDVQSVLKQDKALQKAIEKGMSSDMRTVIAWYNEERLKIQEELHDRNLTNTGAWLDPKKGRSKKPRQVMSEAAIAELERYYEWRKTVIDDARIEEGLSEEEYNRRMEALEQEHLQKRHDLRDSFTSEDKAFIQQFRKWWESVAELDEVEWSGIEAEWKVAWERDRKRNNYMAEKDLASMRAIVVKHLNAIDNIISKERPYDGITRNLQDNLTKMGILFADMDAMNKEALARGNGKKFDDAAYVEQNTKRVAFLLGEAEHAYSLTIEELLQKMAAKGMSAWAEELNNNPNGDAMKQALLAQLRTAYDAVQEAIKKEASLIKKHVDIQWNDVLFDGKSAKGMYESLLSRLGLQEDAVKRANSLIGAGYASEKVADKLAIKQMQIKLRMQEQYFLLIRKTGMERIAQLEAAGKHEDAEHVRKSMNLALTQEQKTLDEQRVALANKLEESQNRLYTELKSWAELLTSSLQSVFEASNTGNAEFYNERAKLQLTGGSGKTEQYIVIDNAGTSDATAHYETLTELEALERKHEIEQQNAMADAWKKVMDDINAKLNETITDQLNAMLQNQSVDMNTDAVTKNTEALLGLTAVINDKGDSGGSGITPSTPQVQIDTTTPGKKASIEVEGLIPGGIVDEDYVPVPYSPAQTGDNGYQFQSPWEVPEDAGDKVVAPWLQMAEANKNATETVLDNQKTVLRGEQETDKKMTASAQSMYAKMTAAMNLYGIAYQAMSNDNLSTAQKFEMIAVQAAGQAAIAALSASMSQSVGQVAAETPAVASKAWSQLGPIGGAAAVAVFTALIGGLIGFATSKIAKSKSEIAAATGAGGNSVASGRLVTGMLTYAEGNVNEFTDPNTLTPGRQYNVDAADGRTYRARYMGKNPRTHITNGPEFHLAGERGREAIIDAATTRHIQMDEVGIWRAIQTLSAGGRIGPRKIPGRGIAAFADGNLDELGDMGAMGGIGTMGGIDLVAVQASLDRNSAIQEALLERLSQPIQAKFDVYGKGGLVDSYDTGKKTAQRYGQRY